MFLNRLISVWDCSRFLRRVLVNGRIIAELRDLSPSMIIAPNGACNWKNRKNRARVAAADVTLLTFLRLIRQVRLRAVAHHRSRAKIL